MHGHSALSVGNHQGVLFLEWSSQTADAFDIDTEKCLIRMWEGVQANFEFSAQCKLASGGSMVVMTVLSPSLFILFVFVLMMSIQGTDQDAYSVCYEGRRL